MLANIHAANAAGKKAAAEELARRRRGGGSTKIRRPERMPRGTTGGSKSGATTATTRSGTSRSTSTGKRGSSHHKRGSSSHHKRASLTDDMSDMSSVTSFGASIAEVSVGNAPSVISTHSQRKRETTADIALEDNSDTEHDAAAVAGAMASPSATLHFETIDRVLMSWEEAQRRHKESEDANEDFEKVLGIHLARSLFIECPAAKAAFGLPPSTNVNDTTTLHSKRFQMHATFLVTMLDGAINLLGPDEDLLTELLQELGLKHKANGVEPRMLPIFAKAVLAALKLVLVGDAADDDSSSTASGGKFSTETQAAWKEVLDKICNDMIRGMVGAAQ